VPLGEPGDVVGDRGAVGLDRAIVAVDRLRPSVGRGFGVADRQRSWTGARCFFCLPATAGTLSPPRPRLACAVAFQQGIASPAPRQSFRVESAESPAKAWISFDFPSTFALPGAGRAQPATARIGRNEARPRCRSNERRIALP